MSTPLADGPAMYFGGTIMTFALPMGAFIVASIVLYYLFRARHSGPRLKYLAGAGAAFSSVATREPGPVPAPPVVAAADEAPRETAAAEAPEEAAEPRTPDQAADPGQESEK